MITAALAGNLYLNYGLWYASPLADARLYAYTQTLPLHYRMDKLLLRIYADARGLPKSITLPQINEDFRHTLVEIFHKRKDIYAYMMNHSILAKHGLIDIRSLRVLHHHMASNPDSADLATALTFERILSTEVNLRLLGFTAF